MSDYPNNHRQPRDGLQYYMRVFAVLGALGGFLVALFAAGALPASAQWIVFAETYGSILSGCVTLWITASILDALRVIAANSFKSPTQEAAPSKQNA